MSHSTSGEEAAASLLHSGTVRAAQRDPRRTCLAVQELLVGGGESRWHGPTLQLGTGTNLKSSRWDADFGSTEDAEFDHSSVPGQLVWSPTLTLPSLFALKQNTTTKHKGPSQKEDWTSIEIGAQLLVGCGRARARNRGGWVDSRDSERDLGAMQRGGGGSSGSGGNTRHSTAAFFKVLPEIRSPLL